MPFNGAGSYSPPGADFPAVAGTLIQSTKFNNVINDIATALSTVIAKDGQTVVTANLPMAGFRHTGVGAAIIAGSYSRVNEVQNGSLVYGGVAGGTADALTLATAVVFTAYAQGMNILFKSGASPNTGAATLAINGIATPRDIQINGAALVANDIEANSWYEVVYDPTGTPTFQLRKVGFPTNFSVSGLLNVTGALQLSGDISPAQITASQNNYNPTGLSTASTLRLNTNASWNLTGLQGVTDGRIILVHNVGTFPLVFTYEDAASTAANRFAFGCTLGGGQSLQMQYDSTTARWRGVQLPEPLGTVKEFATGLQAGFLAVGADYSRTTYASLFNMVGTTYGVGDGSTTFGLFIDGALIPAGTFTHVDSGVDGDVTLGTDTLTVPANTDKWVTGKSVLFTLSSGTITGLTSGNTYFVVRNGTTGVRLASTLALAQAGTFIDMTAKSSPIWSITYTQPIRTAGQRGGEVSHGQATGEESPHNHTQDSHVHGGVPTGSNGPTGGGFQAGPAGNSASTTATNIATAGGTAANVQNPYTVTTRGVRYA